MRNFLFFLLSVVALSTQAIEQRTYITERGDTWESVARKWGLYADELKAYNSFLNELYTGLEIDLPENSAEEPLSTSTIATYEIADRDLEIAKKKIENQQYKDALFYLNSVTLLRRHVTASILYLQGQACEGTAYYDNACAFYKKSLSKHTAGDITLSTEQLSTISERIRKTGELAEEQRKKREAEEKLRREKDRQAEEARIRRINSERESKATTKTTSNNWGWNWGWNGPAWNQAWGMPVITPQIQPQYIPTWDNSYINNAPPVDWKFDPNIAGMNYLNDNSSINNIPSEASSTPGNQITFSDHQCTLCNGKGNIPDSGAITFGLSGSKYCSDCGKQVSLSHQHIQCPSCQGKGTVRKRDR